MSQPVLAAILGNMVIRFHVVERRGNLDRVWNGHMNVYNFKIKWDNVPLVHHSKYPEDIEIE